jgi:multidrug efflux pump subunit AcrA (membrane-fusion protein)
MRIKTKFIVFISVLLLASACKNSGKKEEDAGGKEDVGTPVTVTAVSSDPLVESTELNATSSFMQKSYIKTNVNGYITAVNTIPGKFVNAGQVLFTVKTKEATSINNSINKLDPSFRFSGVNNIKSSSSGYITQLNHQLGDYVQDGEQLAVISDQNSFAFLLNLPYELKRYVAIGNVLDMTLADGTKLKGTVTEALPAVDPGSQTQGIVIKVPNSNNIPESLIARVTIIKMRKDNTISLPKAAVLTNDVQSVFWVMKMIDSNTAVKIPVKKGIETGDRVQILEPAFTASDKILLTGNYGLPDTAKVKVVQQ